MSRAKQIIAQ